MRKLQFAGLVKLKSENEIVTSEDLNFFKPFSMELVFPIFLIYLFACVLSVIILMGEIIWNNFKGGCQNPQ